MYSIPFQSFETSTAILELVFRLKVRDIMTREVTKVEAGTKMEEVHRILKEKSITGLPVVEDDRVLGIISMKDLLNALSDSKTDQRVSDFMSRKIIMLEEDMPIFFAISYFGRYSFRRFPVVDRNKRLVGIVTSRDISNKLLMEANYEIQRLEQEQTSGLPVSGHSERWFKVAALDFENAGFASTEIKKLLRNRRIDPATSRRIATAAYELEMNLVVHSEGGSIHFFNGRPPGNTTRRGHRAGNSRRRTGVDGGLLHRRRMDPIPGLRRRSGTAQREKGIRRVSYQLRTRPRHPRQIGHSTQAERKGEHSMKTENIADIIDAEIDYHGRLDATISGAYTSDLLSDVMGNAHEGEALITIQGHKNSVAVASLVGMPSIILCNKRRPTEDMLAAAKQEQIA
ncbi:MAG TPA: CBS domain-containing protein, partial [Sediminispirochaeta sp.]|nr:CBS domain-containing protein [Sediminispirochaeta sp.]